jgi:hypothetical protein
MVQDRTGWHFKAPPWPGPLYGLDRLAAQPDAPVVICEGEKAADAAGRLFPILSRSRRKVAARRRTKRTGPSCRAGPSRSGRIKTNLAASRCD